MSELSVLLIGDTRRREFARARASLEASGQVVEVVDVAAAEQLLAEGEFVPEVIVLAQAFPDQFTTAQVDRLRQLAPLARLLGLLGSWCEGETRTGHPWPAVIRVYWHQWLPRWHEELARLRDGLCPTWGLPVTATEEERLLVAADAPPEPRSGHVAIHSPRREMEDWLSAVCGSRGYTTQWIQPHRPEPIDSPAAGIFDGTDAAGAELAQLARFRAMLGDAPILALLDFPRIEDHDRATAAGATAVLSKPLMVEDLFWQLDALLGQLD